MRRKPLRLLLTPLEVATVFRHDTDPDQGLRWIYRQVVGRGCLVPATRRVGRELLFDLKVTARLAGIDEKSLLAALEEASLRCCDGTAPQRRNGEEGQ